MLRVPRPALAGKAWFAAAIASLVILPFLVVTIPPLTDVPGHMGSSAIAAYANDPVFTRLMGFHWRVVPNLGADVIVAALQPAIGIVRSYWLVAVSVPLLLTVGIFMIVRGLNPTGAAATPWALIFIYSYTFEYGFLNYMLGVSLALIGFAVWMLLDRRPRLRETITWVAVPLLMLCHAVAGCVFVLLVCSREISLLSERRHIRQFLYRVRPLVSAFAILLVWRLSAHSFVGENKFAVKAKLNNVIMLLRDQNLLLDEGSVVAAMGVFVLGWYRGARPHRAVVPALLGLMVLFVMTPTTLSGSSFADERLLFLLPILAFATQDWSRAGPRLAGAVMACGLALFLTRLAVTFASFMAYDSQFSTNLEALRHIPEYSRIVVLNTSYCSARRHWRASRLGHLGDLAILYRRAWTNTQWDTDGAHMVEVRYRASPRFHDDPSQYVWPVGCDKKDRPTVLDALSVLPVDRIDYLWLIDAALPAGYHNSRLALRWQAGHSALYAVVRKSLSYQATRRLGAGQQGRGSAPSPAKGTPLETTYETGLSRLGLERVQGGALAVAAPKATAPGASVP